MFWGHQSNSIHNTISPETASASDDNLNSLQVKLKSGLSRKKFQLASGDMWKDKYVDWTNQRVLFVAVASRRKVIVTTRNQGVTSIMGTMPAYELKKLVNDSCRLIFSQHPSGTREIVYRRKCLLESVI